MPLGDRCRPACSRPFKVVTFEAGSSLRGPFISCGACFGITHRIRPTRRRSNTIFTMLTTSESSFFLFFLLPRFHQTLYTSGFPCLSAGCRWSGRRWQPRWPSETRNQWELAACCYRGPQATPTSPPPEWAAGRMVQTRGIWATLCRPHFGKRWADRRGAEWPVRCVQPALGAWPKPIDTRTRLQDWLRRGEEAVQQGGHEWWLPVSVFGPGCVPAPYICAILQSFGQLPRWREQPRAAHVCGATGTGGVHRRDQPYCANQVFVEVPRGEANPAREHGAVQGGVADVVVQVLWSRWDAGCVIRVRACVRRRNQAYVWSVRIP